YRQGPGQEGEREGRAPDPGGAVPPKPDGEPHRGARRRVQPGRLVFRDHPDGAPDTSRVIAGRPRQTARPHPAGAVLLGLEHVLGRKIDDPLRAAAVASVDRARLESLIEGLVARMQTERADASSRIVLAFESHSPLTTVDIAQVL